MPTETTTRVTFARFREKFSEMHSHLGIEANQRAARLLWDHLTPQQRRDAYHKNYIEVKLKGGAAHYIGMKYAEIYVDDPGNRFATTLCCEVRAMNADGDWGDRPLPLCDQILAKKLLMEGATYSEFRRKAYA